MSDERRLSGTWGDLQDAGQVPDRGRGKTAEQIERDAKRKRRRFPSEADRVGRKISPTLSAELADRLRVICKAEGYVGKDGQGMIASEVIEDLLWYAIEGYERGELQAEEETITIVKRRLKTNGGKRG